MKKGERDGQSHQQKRRPDGVQNQTVGGEVFMHPDKAPELSSYKATIFEAERLWGAVDRQCTNCRHPRNTLSHNRSVTD